MSLSAKDVAEIARLLEESSFDELYLELDGMKLTLRRSGAPAASALAPRAVSSAAAAPSPSTPALASGAGAAPAGSSPAAALAANPVGVQTVTAPLLGTFYRAPKPGAAPFVEVGAAVEEDTIIGIIEVMKLMNTVRAGMRGVVVEILGRDGVLVEYGEPLIKVRAAS
jgi:acetyl-CoA carboxylase biotin carboxyl carrier protein